MNQSNHADVAPAAGRRKAALLYHDTDKAAMVAAMVKHLQGL